MRSGCTAGAQRYDSVVEPKKDRYANDAAPKSPEDSADAPPRTTGYLFNFPAF